MVTKIRWRVNRGGKKKKEQNARVVMVALGMKTEGFDCEVTEVSGHRGRKQILGATQSHKISKFQNRQGSSLPMIRKWPRVLTCGVPDGGSKVEPLPK